MILKRIFVPKWQHANPSIRYKAIADMEADQPLLLEIYHQEQDLAVRQLIIGKINELSILNKLLDKVVSADTEAELKTTLIERIVTVLTNLKNSAELKQYKDYFDNIKQEDIWKSVLLHATLSELRLQALNLVDDIEVLTQCVLHDEVSKVRLAALDKISDSTALKTILNKSRKKDKKVHRLSKEKLEKLESLAKRPQLIQQEAETICHLVTTIIKQGQWLAFADLEQRWHGVEAEVDAKTKAQYEQVCQQYHQAKQQHQQQQQSQQQQRQCCQSLEKLVLTANQSENIEEVRQQLQQRSDEWQMLPNKTVEYQQQFEHLYQTITTQLTRLSKSQQLLSQLQQLVVKGEQLLQQSPVLLKQLKSWQSQWQTIGHLELAPAQILKQRLLELDKNLNQRYQQQQQQQAEYQQQIQSELSQLQQCLERGNLTEVIKSQTKIQQYLKANDFSERYIKKIEDKLYHLQPQIRELQGWQKWGSLQVKQQLCEQMEALIGSEQHPEDIATAIKELRQQWKKLDQLGHNSNKALWDRFNQAGVNAYQPCQSYFEQRSQERHDNLIKRQQVCEKLEQFLATTNWAEVNWKQSYHFSQKIRKQWREIGPTDRKDKKRIEQRYRQSIDVLNQYLDRERERNLSFRKQLIQQIQDLESLELAQALQQVKHLQQQWETTVPARNSVENQLWRDFKESCDAVYDKKRAQNSEQQQQWQRNQQQKETLLQQLQQLSEVDDIQQMQSEYQQLQRQWSQIGELEKSAVKHLEQQYQQVCQRIEQHQSKLECKQQQQVIALLKAKANICTQIEVMAETRENNTESLTQLKQQWSAFDPLASSDLEQAIHQRYQQALNYLDSLLGFGDACKKNKSQLQMYCIQLEILAGLESPPEFQQQRMQYQVARLSSAMQHDQANTIEDSFVIQQQWYLTGPILTRDRDDLDQRFCHIIANL